MATWNLSETKHHIFICNGSSCHHAGAEEVTQAIRGEIADRNLDQQIHTTRTRCNGRCQDKCVVIVYPKGNWYREIKPVDAPLLIDSLIDNNDMTRKISHVVGKEGFIIQPGAAEGIKKEKEKVKKVSKKLL
ncbi:(2Fe-2S) ferredoxin domain-containing protein [Bacillus aquiflavi]|uniref:(2Fe-2S) ferredoxin domain-containing protein n=1 Tax=Bacillus aquiflavi TaxID=2672567 RepID=A0A6B3W2Q1_9BACI|nr:(2Fe-2S) ferredoxin domain-containing protein [Bacillus aquiflavi]MBA4538655.1 (2Fe-2S) ferredoxin domain-containing protein [Bacillus aquiflavi]NEY83015.1 (2Fe-2S) ferredoxin domain-containing protein [Bacillus aquiflavi]